MWTCPKCAAKVDSQFEVCWQCGTSQDGTEDPHFVSADDAPPIEDRLYDPIAEPDGNPSAQPGGEVVEAYQTNTLMEAKFIADQLNAEGIRAMSDTQDLQDALGTMEGNPRVYVQANDLPRARAWLATYEARRRVDPERFLEE